MLHSMKLYKEPFNSIKNGTKTIELRLNDEKRQKIKPNDEIEFTQIESGEKIKVKVYALHIYKNFDEIYKNFNKEKLGYGKDENICCDDMLNYYSKENIDKYGALAIEIKKFI